MTLGGHRSRDCETWEARETGKTILEKIDVMFQSHGRQTTKVCLFSSFPFFFAIYDKPWIKRLSVKK